MNISFTREQNAAIDAVVDSALNFRGGVHVLTGYAGTGKTLVTAEILKRVASEFYAAYDSPDPWHTGAMVRALAPTAAASAVLETKVANLDCGKAREAIAVGTVSAVTDIHVPVAKFGKVKFRLDKEGIERLGTVWTRLGLTPKNILTVVYPSGRRDCVTPGEERAIVENAGDSEQRPEFSLNDEAMDRSVAAVYGSWAQVPGLDKPAMENDDFVLQSPKFIRRRFVTFGGDDTRPAPLIVVDEASMVYDEQARALVDAATSGHTGNVTLDSTLSEQLGAPATILFVGDPGQIPPVEGKPNSYLYDPPSHAHVHRLTEVKRSTDDVVRLATRVRMGENWQLDPLVRAPTCEELPHRTMDDVFAYCEDDIMGADMVLSYTNQAVDCLNTLKRLRLGYGSDFRDGEQVRCTRNVRSSSTFLNGEFFTPFRAGGDATLAQRAREIGEVAEKNHRHSRRQGGRTDSNLWFYVAAKIESGEWIPFRTPDGREGLTWSVPSSRRSRDDNTCISFLARAASRSDTAWRLPLIPIVYGLASTVNKAQGSEWDTVVYISMPRDRQFQAATLPYTAMTRARKKIIPIYIA